MVLLSIFLFLGQGIISVHFKTLQNQTKSYQDYLDKPENKELAEDVKTLNSLTIRLDTIQKERLLWSKILFELARQTPDKIRLTSFSADKFSKEIKLQGLADTRQDLLVYAENLEASEFFKDVNIPLSAVTQKENIEFSLTLKLEK